MKYRTLFTIAAVAAMLSSCLDVTVDLDVSANSDGGYSGDVRFEYRLDPDFASLGAQNNSDDIMPLPITRRDAERTALRSDGIHLKDYTRTTLDDGAVRAVMNFSFDTLDDLGTLLGTAVEGGKNGITIGLPSSDLNEAGIMDSLILDLAGDRGLEIHVRAPSAVADVSQGESNGRDASLTVSWRDLLTGGGSDTWEVSW